MKSLQQQLEHLQSKFTGGAQVLSLLEQHSQYIDLVVQKYAKLPDSIELYATGGYGRRECYPYSDIDLLIIQTDKPEQESIEKFIQALWDLGFKVGHSVRTFKQCQIDALDDLHFLTALLEARPLLANCKSLPGLLEKIHQDYDLNQLDFLQLKLEEQFQRHEKHGDNLEPNIKSCPGGLRDIQLLAWIAKFYLGSNSLRQTIKAGLYTMAEFRSVYESYCFIASLRFNLHIQHHRANDVLTFDEQKRLSELRGYQNIPGKLAVEQLMQNFYRHTANISINNELLLQKWHEIIHGESKAEIINDDFQWRDDVLDIRDTALYQKRPHAIFETFLLSGSEANRVSLSSRTLRSLHKAGNVMGDEFRKDPINRSNFLAIFNLKFGVTRQLSRLNRLGLLSGYLPLFDDIKGRMQFDLFHRYTVDEHTINVIKECRKIALGLLQEELPFGSNLFNHLDSPQLLYLAAFFHDLGKGRGVDHSLWGAQAIERFCQESDINQIDTDLLMFLVQEHLLLSLTAQKMDLSDANVIQEFAERVGNQRALTYLYLLTVADIRATDPKLWNGWKETLLRSLYLAARDYLYDQSIQSAEEVRVTFTQEHPSLTHLANDLDSNYWLSFERDEAQWQLSEISQNAWPLVRIRQNPLHQEFEVLIFSPRQRFLFAHTTRLIDKHNLSIAQAQFYSTPDDHVLCYFVILNADGSTANKEVLSNLESELEELLKQQKSPRLSKRRKQRSHQHFHKPTEVTISTVDSRNRIEFFATDRPGLLAQVAYVLAQHQLRLHQARIATLGDRVEDVFYVTNNENILISDSEIKSIRQELLALQQ